MMPRLVEVVVAAPLTAWRGIGLDVDDEGCCRIGEVGLRVVAPGDAGTTGIVGWTIALDPDDSGRGSADTIDGVPVTLVGFDSDPVPTSWPSVHPVGAVRFDHLVLFTDDLDRTCAAVTDATGADLRRVREAGPVRQGFHRLGEVILEVVETADAGACGARFWGLVIVVDDVDAACDRLGPSVIGVPRDAVQPGRRIASFRRDADLGLPVALMTR
jgi:hypothetical protein